MSATLATDYTTRIVPLLKEQLGLSSVAEVPRIDKVTLNVGYGRHTKDKQHIERVEKTLAAISGQQPVHNKAKKSISNFKIREGVAIGASVTLRGTAMYEFLYRLINITLPRVRDFRGLNPKSFDAQGNYSIGFKEHVAFPEVQAESADSVHGLEVVIATTATNSAQGFALLEAIGFQFKKK
jgi:large subunit ribosomal protein L5